MPLQYLQSSISRETWWMKLIFYQQISTKVYYKLIVSLWVYIARHAKSSENNKLATSVEYLKEKVKDVIGFWPLDKHQRFFQVDSIILEVFVSRHTQITQNNRLDISLQYREKEVSDEVAFLLAEKHESFLQIDAVILDGGRSKFPK